MTAPVFTPAPANDVWKRSVYQPGDGDVIGAVRPGSLDIAEVPSRFGNELHYRDGRVVIVSEGAP